MSPSAWDRLARAIDAFNTGVGKAASWLYPLLMLVIVVNVVLRYVFEIGSIELEEVQWHLYASGFMLSFAYTYFEDSHVRVAVVHARLPEPQQLGRASSWETK